MGLEHGRRFREDLMEWTDVNMREFPWRDDGLSFYDVFIAEFFLARTRADVVEGVYPEFLSRFPDFEAISKASHEEIVEVIQPMGLQNRRADALKQMADRLREEGLPRNEELLLELPRVGQYATNATLCFAENEPRPIVDTNIDRIFGRILGDEWPEDRDEQIKLLDELVPSDSGRLYNLGLLDFGALVCTARSPRCEECFARDYCRYYNEGDR
ncbi:hypothetical protein [Haloarchaeobius sp. HRN-SO-5]|uniref:hypothetical protein n=1 Tax=Haloarchaeobius sp. HRN-SO-5 TaxID=3446118 RepID=UPI003EBDEB97